MAQERRQAILATSCSTAKQQARLMKKMGIDQQRTYDSGSEDEDDGHDDQRRSRVAVAPHPRILAERNELTLQPGGPAAHQPPPKPALGVDQRNKKNAHTLQNQVQRAQHSLHGHMPSTKRRHDSLASAVVNGSEAEGLALKEQEGLQRKQTSAPPTDAITRAELLERQVAALQASGERAEAERAALQASCDAARHQLDATTIQLKEAERRVKLAEDAAAQAASSRAEDETRLRQRVASMQSELAVAMRKAEVAEAAAAEEAKIRGESESALVEARKRVEALQIELNRAKSDERAFRLRIAELDADTAAMSFEMKKLKPALTDARNEAVESEKVQQALDDSLRQELCEARQKQDELRSKLVDAQQGLQEAHAQVQRLQRELNDAKQCQDDVTAPRPWQDEHIDQLKDELQQDVVVARHERDQLISELADAKQQLQTMDVQYERVQRELSALKQERDGLESAQLALPDGRAELEKVQRELFIARHERDGMEMKFKSAQQELQSQLEQAQRQCSSAASEQAYLESKLAAAQQQAQDAVSQYEQLHARYLTLEQHYLQMNEILSTKDREHSIAMDSEVHRRCFAAEAKTVEAEAALCAVRAQRDELESRCASLEVEIAAKRVQFENRATTASEFLQQPRGGPSSLVERKRSLYASLEDLEAGEAELHGANIKDSPNGDHQLHGKNLGQRRLVQLTQCLNAWMTQQRSLMALNLGQTWPGRLSGSTLLVLSLYFFLMHAALFYLSFRT
jgi:chromosome segregation ATPase